MSTSTYTHKSAKSNYLFCYSSDHRLHAFKVALDTDLKDAEADRVLLTEDTLGTIVPKDFGRDDANRDLRLSSLDDCGVAVPCGDAAMAFLFEEGKLVQAKVDVDGGVRAPAIIKKDGRAYVSSEGGWFDVKGEKALGLGDLDELLKAAAAKQAEPEHDPDDDLFETINNDEEVRAEEARFGYNDGRRLCLREYAWRKATSSREFVDAPECG